MKIYSNKNRKIKFIILILIYIILVVVACSLGAARLPLLETLKVFIKKIPFLGNYIAEEIAQNKINIIFNIRLPRIVMASIVGIGLSLSGTSYQAIFKNSLADPYILGISSGASLGAVISMLLKVKQSFLGFGITTFMAFAGALLTVFIVYGISRINGRISVNNLLLAGVTVGYFFSAMISIAIAYSRETAQRIIFWTMGSLSYVGWKHVWILLPILIICYIVMYSLQKDLNIMLNGDEWAKSNGVEVEWVKRIILITSSLLVAICVAFTGVIGFVGLMIPHIMRLLVGADHKYLIPFSALGGAVFLLFADTLARTVLMPSELPVGAITAFIGAPFFIYLLIKRKRVEG